jgi:putative transposase
MVKRSRTKDRYKSDEVLAAQVSKIKEEHPFWGYRRVWAWLRYREGQRINEKRVYRVMREHDLLCPKKLRRQLASRTPRSKPRADRPNQYWGTDMTKIYVAGHGWVYLVLTLDWYTKKIVGSHVNVLCRSSEWLAALDEAVNRQFPGGVRGKGLRLISDNGCQPTSNAFHTYCCQTDIEQIFTSYNNPKGNADTERMMRTIKEELLWLHEWTHPDEVSEAVSAWIEQYNETYPHSSLGYQSPLAREAAYFQGAAA